MKNIFHKIFTKEINFPFILYNISDILYFCEIIFIFINRYSVKEKYYGTVSRY